MERVMFVHPNAECSLPCPRGEISPEFRSFEPKTQLQQTIRDLRISEDAGKAPERLAKIGVATEDDLFGMDRCALLPTKDGDLYFFDRELGRIVLFGSQPFNDILSARLGVGPGERDGTFRSVVEQFRVCALHIDPVPIHTFSLYDPEAGTLVVSDGARHLYRHKRGDDFMDWEKLDNGDEGLFFHTSGGVDPWTPDFTCLNSLDWLLKNICFDPNASLSRSEQETLLRVFLVERFFPCLQRHRIIPAFLGSNGSGKTSAVGLIGGLIDGVGWEPILVEHNEQAEDNYWTAVTTEVVVGLDNVDSQLSWIEDALAVYSTGGKKLKRKLYTDNDRVVYRPTSILMITSRDPHFRRPDVAERLLQFYCARPVGFSPTWDWTSELKERRNLIMGSLLVRAAAVSQGLKEYPLLPTSFRLADFASLGHVIMKTLGHGDEWEPLLAKLSDTQAEFATEGHPLVESLAAVLNTGRLMLPAETDMAGLYRTCVEVAPEWMVKNFKSVRPFSQVLRNMKTEIEKRLSIQIALTKTCQTTRVKIVKTE